MELTPDASGLELDALDDPPMLNSARVPDGHRFAVLDGECDTMATAPTREQAIEDAARKSLRAMSRRADIVEYRLRRVTAAIRTIETGGAE